MCFDDIYCVLDTSWLLNEGDYVKPELSGKGGNTHAARGVWGLIWKAEHHKSQRQRLSKWHFSVNTGMECRIVVCASMFIKGEPKKKYDE